MADGLAVAPGAEAGVRGEIGGLVRADGAQLDVLGTCVDAGPGAVIDLGGAVCDGAPGEGAARLDPDAALIATDMVWPSSGRSRIP